MATSLLPEIIVNILCRLTVRDLLRCRSVSKTWSSLIDGPDFIKLHLNHSIETSSNLHLVLNAGDLHWLDLDTRRSPERLNQVPIVNGDDGKGIEILGCCNGVLAIANGNRNMALWNPSTRRYIKLSASDVIDIVKFPSRGVVSFGATGFGYDHANDDYKLLRVVFLIDIDLSAVIAEAKLYSVKAKAWKTLNGFPLQYYGYKRCHGVLVSGAFHWLVSEKPKCDSFFLIVAFDLVTEEYRKVPVPYYQDKSFFLKLGELGGWLSLVKIYNPDNNYSDRVEIWVMKEYLVQESWIMLFSVVPSNVTGSFSYAEPVAYLKSTDEIVLDLGGENLILYDLEEKRVRNLRALDVPKYSEAKLCVGSLVGFDSRDGEKTTRKQAGEDRNERKERKPQRGRKKRDDFLSEGFKLVL